MNFGKINNYILFGGGQLLVFSIQLLKRKSVSSFVVTSKRHSEEMIMADYREMSLLEFLRRNRMGYIISQEISIDRKVIEKITKNTLGVSFGATWIFKRDFISLFDGRLVNLHGTRLPQDRGGGGFSWRILRGDRFGISLIHQISLGIDTGDIIFSEEYIYPSNCRLPIDYQRYSIEKYQDLLLRFYSLIAKGKPFTSVSQQECFSSYWPRLHTKTNAYIDWSWPLEEIERFICAFDDPYAGAATFINGKIVRLKKCYVAYDNGVFHPFQRGLVYRITESEIFVAAGQGTLIITSLLNNDGRDIKQDICLGERFFTPERFLEMAKEYRAIYTPEGLKPIDKNKLRKSK